MAKRVELSWDQLCADCGVVQRAGSSAVWCEVDQVVRCESCSGVGGSAGVIEPPVLPAAATGWSPVPVPVPDPVPVAMPVPVVSWVPGPPVAAVAVSAGDDPAVWVSGPPVAVTEAAVRRSARRSGKRLRNRKRLARMVGVVGVVYVAWVVGATRPVVEAVSEAGSSVGAVSPDDSVLTVGEEANELPGSSPGVERVVVDGGSLAALVADPDPGRDRYDRDLFFEGGDVDGDCVRTRHEVLQEEAVWHVMDVQGCKVAAGEWQDPFSGLLVGDPGDLQVDHVVSLGDAWRSGAWQWSNERREAFGNDLGNLNAIWGPENQTKSDSGPSGYAPSNGEHLCDYLLQYSTVKTVWGLTITQTDFDALEAGLANCDGSGGDDGPVGVVGFVESSPVPTTTVNAVTTDAVVSTAATAVGVGCHPAYSGCVPNLVGDLNCPDLDAVLKPVRVLVPGVDPYGLDGDSDGVGCEGR